MAEQTNLWEAIDWVATDVAKKSPGTRYWKGTIYMLWDMARKEYEAFDDRWVSHFPALRRQVLAYGTPAVTPSMANAVIYLITDPRDPDHRTSVDSLVLVDVSPPPSAQAAYEHMNVRRPANTCQFCGYTETTEHGRNRLEPIAGSNKKIHSLCKSMTHSWRWAESEYEASLLEEVR